MKKDFFKPAIVKCFPVILISSVLLFLLFMIIGFVVKNDTASNVMFALSFIFLLLYIPSFIVFSKLQNKKWFKEYARCFSLKKAEKENAKKMKIKAEEMKKEFFEDTSSNQNQN